MGRSAAEAWPGVEGEGGGKPPPDLSEVGFERQSHTTCPVSRKLCGGLKALREHRRTVVVFEFRLTGSVFDRIGFEVSLRSVFNKSKKYARFFWKNIQYFMKIGSGRGPGTIPGDPKMPELRHPVGGRRPRCFPGSVLERF